MATGRSFFSPLDYPLIPNPEHLMKQSRETSREIVVTPTLNEFESTAEVGNRVEKLSSREYEIFAQLMRYPEQAVQRDSLKRVIGIDDESLSDRRLDAMMLALIRKANVLCPAFPVVRFVEPDSYVYTEQPPRRPKN